MTVDELMNRWVNPYLQHDHGDVVVQAAHVPVVLVKFHGDDWYYLSGKNSFTTNTDLRRKISTKNLEMKNSMQFQTIKEPIIR